MRARAGGESKRPHLVQHGQLLPVGGRLLLQQQAQGGKQLHLGRAEAVALLHDRDKAQGGRRHDGGGKGVQDPREHGGERALVLVRGEGAGQRGLARRGG